MPVYNGRSCVQAGDLPLRNTCGGKKMGKSTNPTLPQAMPDALQLEVDVQPKRIDAILLSCFLSKHAEHTHHFTGSPEQTNPSTWEGLRHCGGCT